MFPVELEEAEGGGEGVTLADEDGPRLVGEDHAAVLAAAEAAVDDLEVAVGAAAVVGRLEAAQLKLVKYDLKDNLSINTYTGCFRVK